MSDLFLIPLLRTIKFLIPPKSSPVHLDNPRRILVLDFAYVGDMIMTSPVYRNLKERFPAASVEAFVFPLDKGIMKTNPYVDEVHVHPTGFHRIALRVILALRKKQYDVGIQVNTSLRNNFILWMIHPAVRVGYDFRHRGCFHNVRIPIAARTAHTIYRVDEELALLEKGFGWNITNRKMVYHVEEEVKRRIGRMLQEKGIKEDDLVVGIHCNSRQTHEFREWDPMKFVEIIDRIAECTAAKFIFTGGPSDEEYQDNIIRRLRSQDRVVRGLLFNLEELGALFLRMNLFLTINTGPMHIAIAQNTPTVAIIGVAPARVIFPQDNPRFQFVMDKALEDWDTTTVHLKYSPRITEIGVDEVFQKVKYLLDHFASSAPVGGVHSSHS